MRTAEISKSMTAARSNSTISLLRYWIHAAQVLAAATLTGCTMGPDFHRPEAPDVRGYTREELPARTAGTDIAGGAAQDLITGLDIPGQWWTLFRSPQLNALIEQALRANPDMRVAQAALRQALENVYAQMGTYYPSVQASFS